MMTFGVNCGCLIVCTFLCFIPAQTEREREKSCLRFFFFRARDILCAVRLLPEKPKVVVCGVLGAFWERLIKFIHSLDLLFFALFEGEFFCREFASFLLVTSHIRLISSSVISSSTSSSVQER